VQQAEPDEMLFREAPEAYGYEFQSSGVVDLLEKLMVEFSSKKKELEAEELKAQHSFEQITQQLTDNVENAEHEISKKTTLRAETQKAKAESEGNLESTEKDKAEDTQYLDEMTALCGSKSTDFASRQKLRAEEIGALTKAIEVISSRTVAGAGETYLPSLLQRPSRSALAQLRSGQQNPWQERAAAFLAGRAQKAWTRPLGAKKVP